jgi:hypothetical protein
MIIQDIQDRLVKMARLLPALADPTPSEVETTNARRLDYNLIDRSI